MQREIVKPKTSPSDSWFAFPRTLLPLPEGLASHHFAVLLTLASTVSRSDGKWARAGHTTMPEDRLAYLVGSWAGRRTGETPSSMNITMLRRNLREIEQAGVGRLLQAAPGQVVFKWATRYRYGLEARGGRANVVEQGQAHEVSRAWIKVPKAVAYDRHLTGTEKLVYVALCWGVFQLPASRSRHWFWGTYVSQKSILPEWTGKCERTVNSTVDQLEKARLIERHPDQVRGRVPRIGFVPVSVRYVRLLGGPLRTTRKQQALYLNLPAEEREARYGFWLSSEQRDLPESLWNAVWHEWNENFVYMQVDAEIDRLVVEERRVAESAAKADREVVRQQEQDEAREQERKEQELRVRMPLTAAQREQREQRQAWLDDFRRRYGLGPKSSGGAVEEQTPTLEDREQLVGRATAFHGNPWFDEVEGGEPGRR